MLFHLILIGFCCFYGIISDFTADRLRRLIAAVCTSFGGLLQHSLGTENVFLAESCRSKKPILHREPPVEVAFISWLSFRAQRDTFQQLAFTKNHSRPSLPFALIVSVACVV
jgi:hypothetical protein